MPSLSTSSDANPVLVQAFRGGAVESEHRGAVVVGDADGHVLCALGDIDRRVFPRSAIKLLQALPLVTSGAAERFGFGAVELALACASHNGEDAHTQAVASALAKLGLDAGALECGTQMPPLPAVAGALQARGEKPCALHNNCSGKHAGFLALGAMLAGDAPGDVSGRSSGHSTSSVSNNSPLRRAVQGYVHPDHAVMREVTQAVATATGFDLSTTARGTDGCSIPTFAIPLRHLALAYARVATGAGLSAAQATAARVLRQAAAQQPFMTAGTGRFDTDVMGLLGERVYCKVGAEAVYCAALPERGLGVAIKIDDGNNARAAEVVMAAVIAQFVAMDATEHRAMQARSKLALRNWNRIDVGSPNASGPLMDALTA